MSPKLPLTTPSPALPVAALLCAALLTATLLSTAPVAADDHALTIDDIVSQLRLRSIGPAMMGGRIADIAIHPDRPHTWYLGVGSGGVWKTTNSGTTWAPIFDDQPSYSIGCVTIDPANPDVVWVGTGENVSGRHVGWGSGVYRSDDGGASWRAMGLESSEHIGRILVDPRDSDVVLVAAEGPLWSSGGERGVYRSADGGSTWERVLHVDDDTGATSLERDPSDPDVLYAATYQRRRSVWSHLAGGPGSGIHKSTDGGLTWTQLESGLPSGDMGKIGLTVSPVDPAVIYATIEAHEDERGFYRSVDRGATWTKRSSYLSNGTGPHYYQEIYASPHDVDHVYQMDVFLHQTLDGGANFEIVGNGREKHSDNHALWIDPGDANHLLIGTDAGLYESFDRGTTWRHTPNLPISQLYKLAVEQTTPFYDLLGGAQDLGTLHGPARSRSREGIRSSEWYVPLGADGYSSAFDREDSDLLYIEWQVGRLVRYDRKSEEMIDIQPLPAAGEPAERFNWDAPVRTSPHSPTRLYFASQRLWRSDNRGDSWTAISGDLTRGENRYTLPMAGRVQSVDALYDNTAMSWYATVTSIAESPLDEALVYTGSDDGLVQVTEDGGDNWRRCSLPREIPERSFVNDLRASQHDADTVFAVLDNHKEGDFRPLLIESRDRCRSWRSIAGDLPEASILWAVDEDHVLPELLFVGAEHGLWATLDGGERWIELSAGVPTISFRDIEIHRERSDLVAATFGRGMYVLDDYSPLRELAKGGVPDEGSLFPVRDTWAYVPTVPMQAPGKPTLGSTDYAGENPPQGALLRYLVTSDTPTAAERRREGESDGDGDVSFPGWETLREEALESAPEVLVTIRDAEGDPVRRLAGPATRGLHTLSWDLRRQAADPVELSPPSFRPPWAGERQGPLVAPGSYSATLELLTADGSVPLGGPQAFEVHALAGRSLPSDFAAAAAFQERTAALLRDVVSEARELGRHEEAVAAWRATLEETPAATAEMFGRLETIRRELAALRLDLLGDSLLGEYREPSAPSIARRVRQVEGGHWETRERPTATQRSSLAIAEAAFAALLERRAALVREVIEPFRKDLEAAGAPWIP